MSLLQRISKEGRKERALKRACAKASNHLIKPDDRKPALFLLVEEGTDDAIRGLLSRFTFNYTTNTVSDEEEKQYVFERLGDMGGKVLPHLKTHLKSSPSLSWGLRLLARICGPEDVWHVLSEVLSDYDAEYERDPSRKLQLLTFLGELDDERVTDALLPFIEDHDETVRYTVIEGLFRREDEVAREPLLKRLTDEDEESIRIKNRIAVGFADVGWPVKGYRGAVEKNLSSDYIIDGKGRIRRKKGNA